MTMTICMRVASSCRGSFTDVRKPVRASKSHGMSTNITVLFLFSCFSRYVRILLAGVHTYMFLSLPLLSFLSNMNKIQSVLKQVTRSHVVHKK